MTDRAVAGTEPFMRERGAMNRASSLWLAFGVINDDFCHLRARNRRIDTRFAAVADLCDGIN